MRQVWSRTAECQARERNPECFEQRRPAAIMTSMSLTPKVRPSQSDLPEQVADAIRQAWPDGVIDMPADTDDAPFWKVHPKLKLSLSRIPKTAVFHERKPQGDPQWGESSDLGEDPPDWNEESHSYYLFFLSPLDDRFRFETDTIEPGEDGIEQRFQGEGRVGIAVGISLIAPFAVVTLDEMEVFENGSRSEPGVEPHIFGLVSSRIDRPKPGVLSISLLASNASTIWCTDGGFTPKYRSMSREE